MIPKTGQSRQTWVTVNKVFSTPFSQGQRLKAAFFKTATKGGEWCRSRTSNNVAMHSYHFKVGFFWFIFLFVAANLRFQQFWLWWLLHFLLDFFQCFYGGIGPWNYLIWHFFTDVTPLVRQVYNEWIICFCWAQNKFISPLSLKDSFIGYRILHLTFIFLSDLWIYPPTETGGEGNAWPLKEWQPLRRTVVRTLTKSGESLLGQRW